MKDKEAIKKAVEAYTKDLKKNGTQQLGVSIAISSGLSFLIYYKKFKEIK